MYNYNCCWRHLPRHAWLHEANSIILALNSLLISREQRNFISFPLSALMKHTIHQRFPLPNDLSLFFPLLPEISYQMNIALQKVPNSTLKKSIDQTLSVRMFDFLAMPGRCRWVAREEQYMSGTSTDALSQLITCAKTLIAETAVAPLYETLCLSLCLSPTVCDSAKSPWDRGTFRSEYTKLSLHYKTASTTADM